MAESDPIPEGVFRDGRYLVVDLHNCRFPLRCVKTNRPVGYYTRHEVPWRQKSIIAITLWFAVCVYVRQKLTIAYGVYGECISAVFVIMSYEIQSRVIWRPCFLRVGLHEEYVVRRKRASRIGWRLTLGGLLGLILLAMFQLAAALNDLVLSSDTAVNGLSVVLALLTLSGFPFLIFAHFPVFRRRKRKEPFVWLAGAHHDFLDSLPPWEPQPGRDSD